MATRMSANVLEYISLVSFLLAIFLGVLALANSFYFYKRYQPPLDKATMKDLYFEKGYMLCALDQLMYAHYCLFPKRAKRDGFYELFSTLESRPRKHLIFHWFAVVIGIFLACVIGVILKFGLDV